MKKNLLITLLALVLVFAFASTAMAAANNEIDNLSRSTVESALDYLGIDYSYDADTATIILTASVTLSNDDYLLINLPRNKELTIDLVGYTLDGDADDLIYVKGGSLVIMDSSADEIGAIINANASGVAVSISGDSGNAGSVTLESGNIKGAEAGVSMLSNTEFIMDGGEINAITDGIYAEDCEITINDGFIYSANTGVYIEDGEFTMNGGLIDINNTSYSVYGVWAENSAVTFSGDFTVLANYEETYISGTAVYFETDNGSKAELTFNRASGCLWGSFAALQIKAEKDFVVPDMSTSIADAELTDVKIKVQGEDVYYTFFGNEGEEDSDDFAYDLHVDFYPVGINEVATLAASVVGVVGNGAVSPAYINGYPDGTFKAENPISRAEASKILSIASGKVPGANNAGYYSDIVTSSWYAPYVSTMSSEGWINGYIDGTYRPDNNITIAELIAVLCRIKNVNAVAGNSVYTDISGNWAEGYIKAAEQQGWLAGTFGAGQLNPGNAINRIEAVQLVNAATGRNNMGFSSYGPSFSDIQADSPYYDAVLRASSDML